MTVGPQTSPSAGQRWSDDVRVRLRTGVRHLVLLPVYLWRSLAPVRAPRCRFHPTCSTYAVHAVRGHGVLRGTVLASRRVGRCHPWNPGGFDHVPDVDDRSAWRRARH